MGEEDTGHRRSIGGHDDLMAVEESSANIAKSQSQIRNEQLSDSPPGSKRRKPSSPDGVSESTWSQTDQGATTPRPIEASVSSTSSSSSSREATADGQHFGSDVQLSKAHPGKSGRDKRNSLRQPPPATRRPSASAQPETSSITSTSGASLDKSTSNLARLPSLSSIAHDLPSTGSGFHHSQPPKGLSSPVSARSRGSISSRGSSSPRASSSSSSSSAGKRRYGSIAPETGVLSRSASQVPE